MTACARLITVFGKRSLPEEIRALSGADELKAWDKRGAWPVSPGWSPPQETIAANVAQLSQSLAASVDGNNAALLVTSNGILRFFLKLVPGAFEDMAARGLLKVATGGCCALAREASSWRVVFWNRQPHSLALLGLCVRQGFLGFDGDQSLHGANFAVGEENIGDVDFLFLRACRYQKQIGGAEAHRMPEEIVSSLLEQHSPCIVALLTAADHVFFGELPGSDPPEHKAIEENEP